MSTSDQTTAVASDFEGAAQAALREAEEKGRFESLEALRDVHSFLLAKRGAAKDDEGRAPPDILDVRERFLTLGAATGVIVDAKQDRWETQSLLDYWYTVQYRDGKRPAKPRLAPLDESLLLDLDNSACPYRGLDAFREKDSPYFFGRDGLRKDLLDMLAEAPILAVVGPSGSGKSSVVRAGLIPDLRTGGLPGSESWTILPLMVPGSDPLDSLARLVVDHQTDPMATPAPAPPSLEPAATLAKEARQDKHCLAKRLDKPSGPPVVVAIDQFEEVFTLCKNAKDAQALIDNLLELVRTKPDAAVKNRVILTMRSDFQVHLQKYPELLELFRAGRVPVMPMAKDQLRKAIEGPAQQAGLVFEKGVVEALVEDTFAEPGALPLLQFALLKLWEGRWHNKVTMEAYRRLGGSREALATAADELFTHMNRENQDAAKRIFLRIVRPGEGLEVTNKRIPLGDLHPPGEDHARTDEVLDKLVKARLVRLTPGLRNEDTQVEVAHEALVRNWPRLVNWLEKQRGAIVARQRLELKVAEWVGRGRGDDALLDEAQLPDARSWLDSTDAAELGVIPYLRDLVDASAQAIKKKQRLWYGAIFALGILTVSSVIAAGIAVRQSDNARKESEKAKEAFRQADANYVKFVSSKLLQAAKEDSGNSDRSLLLAQKAVAALQSRNLPIPAEFSQTLEALVRQPAVKFDISHVEKVLVYYDRSGQLLATSTYGSNAALWDANTGKKLSELAGTADKALMALAFSPDGEHLATADLEGRAKIWRFSTAGQDPKPAATLGGGHKGAIFAVAFAPAAAAQNRLATAGDDGMVVVWDGNTGRQISRLSGHNGKVFTVAYSADGRQLASGGLDGTAILWDTSLSKPTRVLQHPHGVVTAVAFDPGGTRIATVCTDGHVHLWDTRTGDSLKTLQSGKVAWYGGLAFSPDGQILATSGIDKNVVVKLWRIPSGERELSITVGDNYAHALAFRPDLKRFAIASPAASAGSVTGQRQDQPALGSTQTVKIFEIRKIENLLESIRKPEQYDLTVDDYLEILKDLSPDHFDHMVEARNLAKNDDVDGALAKINEALKLPGLDLNIDRESKRLVAEFLLERGCMLAREGKPDEALKMFGRAQELPQ